MNEFENLIKHIDFNRCAFIQIGFINDEKIILFLQDIYKLHSYKGSLKENDKISKHLSFERIKSCSSYSIEEGNVVNIKKAIKASYDYLLGEIMDGYEDESEFFGLNVYDFVLDVSKILYVTPIYIDKRENTESYSLGYEDKYKDVVIKKGLFKRQRDSINQTNYPKYVVRGQKLMTKNELTSFMDSLDKDAKEFIEIKDVQES